MTDEDKRKIAEAMFTQDSASLGTGVLDEIPGAYGVLDKALKDGIDLGELVRDAAGPMGKLPARFNSNDLLIRAMWRTFFGIIDNVVKKAHTRSMIIDMTRGGHAAGKSRDASRNEGTGPWYEQPLPL